MHLPRSGDHYDDHPVPVSDHSGFRDHGLRTETWWRRLPGRAIQCQPIGIGQVRVGEPKYTEQEQQV